MVSRDRLTNNFTSGSLSDDLPFWPLIGSHSTKSVNDYEFVKNAKESNFIVREPQYETF